jgi:hypothetical protein
MAVILSGPLLAAKILGGAGVLGALAAVVRWTVHR